MNPRYVLVATLGMPGMSGMSDHTHLKSQQQFVAFIDVNLYAKNQLYTSNSFWEIKV